MEMPSKRKLSLLMLIGFILALLEPIVLLALGYDLGGAFWPMAKRSLQWTYWLRENRTLVFAFFLLAVPFSYYRSQSSSKYEKIIAISITGFLLGLLFIFTLLNYAYFRDAFLLLPTTYGFMFLCLALIIAGLPRNPFVEGREKISTASHFLLVILAVWLITPGLSAMAGLSPYPPELKLADGQYEIQIDDYEDPLPEEVSSIRVIMKKMLFFQCTLHNQSRMREIYL